MSCSCATTQWRGTFLSHPSEFVSFLVKDEVTGFYVYPFRSSGPVRCWGNTYILLEGMTLLEIVKSLEAFLWPLGELGNGRGGTMAAARMTGFASWATHLCCSTQRVSSIHLRLIFNLRQESRRGKCLLRALKHLGHFGCWVLVSWPIFSGGHRVLLTREMLLCFCWVLRLISFQLEQETDPRKRSFFGKFILPCCLQRREVLGDGPWGPNQI